MTALEAAKQIERDVRSRKGLGNEFEEIDPEIQEEIVAEWAEIIQAALDQESRESFRRGARSYSGAL